MSDTKRIEHIIWDWNGTLLNDIDICIKGINQLLSKRDLATISKERYKEIFTFPIKNYYEKAGFDFSNGEAFEVPAEEFIIAYRSLMHEASLFPDVKETLDLIKTMGIRQYVLSAMEEQSLADALKLYGIDHFFDGVYGISDNYATSKIERGKELINDHKLIPQRGIIVGDTLHDLEVAAALESSIILIGRGHQNRSRLVRSRKKVVQELSEIVRLIDIDTGSTIPNAEL